MTGTIMLDCFLVKGVRGQLIRQLEQIRELAEDDLQHDRYKLGSNIHQIEADARAAIESVSSLFTEDLHLKLDEVADAALKEENAKLTSEVHRLTVLNEDKFRTIQAYCKAADSDKAQLAAANARVAELEAENRRLRGTVLPCLAVLESLWAAEHDGKALCDEIKQAIRVALKGGRELLGIKVPV